MICTVVRKKSVEDVYACPKCGRTLTCVGDLVPPEIAEMMLRSSDPEDVILDDGTTLEAHREVCGGSLEKR